MSSLRWKHEVHTPGYSRYAAFDDQGFCASVWREGRRWLMNRHRTRRGAEPCGTLRNGRAVLEADHAALVAGRKLGWGRKRG